MGKGNLGTNKEYYAVVDLEGEFIAFNGPGVYTSPESAEVMRARYVKWNRHTLSMLPDDPGYLRDVQRGESASIKKIKISVVGDVEWGPIQNGDLP